MQSSLTAKIQNRDFPSGRVEANPSASEEDTGLTSGLGRFRTPVPTAMEAHGP